MKQKFSMLWHLAVPLTALTLLVLFVIELGKNESASLRLAQLEAQHSRLNARGTTASSQNCRIIVTGPEQSEAGDSGSSSRTSQPRNGAARAFERPSRELDALLVRMQTDALAKFTSLTEDQRAELEDLLTEDIATAPLDSEQVRDRAETREQRLRDILGNEVVDTLQASERERELRKQNEEQEKEVLLLSRELSLNNEQEQKLREALNTLQNPPTVEASKIEGTGPPPTENLQDMMEYVKQYRNSYLSNELKGVLSESQFNKLLELQVSRDESGIYLPSLAKSR